MRVARTTAELSNIPVDFFADPDGLWDYEDLVQEAGFTGIWGDISIGALGAPFDGFPEGAAVVSLTSGATCSVVLVDCSALDADRISSAA